MTNNKKEQERSALHSTIWRIASDLRGSVDGWDFKQYVLGMLFYRFISENLASHLNKQEHESGDKNFNYATTIDDNQAESKRDDIVQEKGFFIPPSGLFDNIRKAANTDKGKEELNKTLKTVFDNIENSSLGTKSEKNMRGLFSDIDVNSNKLGATVLKRNTALVELMNAVSDMNLAIGDNSIDLFGDAYEYLMAMYAANAGKSGGEFFTPQEVSELLARITVVGKIKVNKVYDPACGSGSLLLKFAKVLDKVDKGFFGQEINITTYNLCRINMFLHNINYVNFDIAHGNTLSDPKHWDEEPFEAIVSNPPYSIKWEGDLINDKRFTPAGILAPKSKADLAFVMHALAWLATNGTAAIVSFPGVLYRGGAEKKIRQYLIDNNFIDAVIQLPKDLFFGTTIATCILVLKKNKKENKTLFINASAEFVRRSAKNKLTEANAKKILDCYVGRDSIEHFARLVDNKEVAEQDYNISVSSYVTQKNTCEIVDIAKLNAHIKTIVDKQTELRTQIDAIVANLEGKIA
ncbi:MAG: type I restriction-modification system subunit M [Candidatus Liberibacter asiaticus]|nr:type I restriction-modification system subunit M [Candidatus Liberibacter asiaticus]